MKALIFSALLALTSAIPFESIERRDDRNVLDPFYIVTTTQRTKAASSSELANVQALTIFDPYYQTNLVLRTTGPGYGSLNTFNLTQGTLHTASSGPHGIGYYLYNSTIVQPNDRLQLAPSPQPKGNIAIQNKHLITVNGQPKGWKLCTCEFSQTCVYWKGTDPSCTDVFLQAVAQPPY